MNESLADLLRSANWLPAGQRGAEELSASDNLLATVAETWRATAAPLTPGARARHEALRTWFDQQLAAGARLTTDLPSTANPERRNRSDTGLVGRFCWWPRGLPEGEWVAIVSSRLGKRLDQRPEWFDVFRAACAKIDTQHSVLLTGAQTTTARFAERAANLFDLPTLVIHEPRSGDSILSWLRRILRQEMHPNASELYEVFLSPPFSPPAPEQEGVLSNLPLCDRFVVAWADRVFVAHLRRGGNLEQLIRWRLARSRHLPPDVFLALGPRLVSSNLADELLGAGAVGWVLLPQQHADEPGGCNEVAADPDSLAESATCGTGDWITPRATIDSLSPVNRIVLWGAFITDQADREWSFLTHCTRTPAGPWPEQSDQEFLDELLSQRRPADRSPLAAISRIVVQQRILASAAALRGGTPAVCFTEVPLTELHQLRVFQPQRQCWDFEPYGICVQRDWLAARGARPVTYGNERDWEALPAVDRPFFQQCETRRGVRHRDWTHEREWRHVGDVNLSLLSAADALVFVPTVGEAERVARISRWPIVVCR